MRPRYETEQDRERELAVMKVVGKAWGVEFTKLPDRYILDYALTIDDKVVGFAEVKCRNVSSTTYDTTFLGSEKVKTAMVWGNLKVPVTGIFKFTDGIFTVPLESPDFFAPGGRKDRNDPDDQEVMAHFKQAKLKRFSGDSRVTRTLVPTPD